MAAWQTPRHPPDRQGADHLLPRSRAPCDTQAHVDTIMAGILMIGVLGVMTDLLFRLVAHLLFPWNVERKG